MSALQYNNGSIFHHVSKLECEHSYNFIFTWIKSRVFHTTVSDILLCYVETKSFKNASLSVFYKSNIKNLCHNKVFWLIQFVWKKHDKPQNISDIAPILDC